MGITTNIIESPMTEERAGELTLLIRQHVSHVRLYLWEMYENDGWKVMGYNSWRDYLINEFKDISYPYLTRQTKAARLEAIAGGNVGEAKEAHLRPIIESLDNDGDMIEAYKELASIDSPTGADAASIAARLSVERTGLDILKERMRLGHVSPIKALGVANALGNYKSGAIQIVSDPELAELLVRLMKANSETWQEIEQSLSIPAFPEPILIEDATASNLLAWLDVASAEHRAIAIEKKRAYFNRLNEATDKLIDETSRLAAGGEYDGGRIKSLVLGHMTASERDANERQD